MKSKSGVCKAENDSLVGFSDLTDTDFSMKKFPLIAKYACEAQARRPSSDILAFVCPVCSKAFPCNRTLKQHEKIHEENANTFCDECQYDISSPNHQQTHQLKHQSMKKYAKIKIDDRLESDKENFLAVLGLQARTLRPRTNDVPVSSSREPEDCISQERLYNGISVTDKEMLKITSNKNYQPENINDFADISSIISLTSEATLPDMRSSPITAAPASPENDVVDHDRESPVKEGSANTTFDLSSSENTNSNRDSDSHNDISNKQDSLQCRQFSLCFGTMKTHRKSFVCQICNLGFSTKDICNRNINQQHPKCKDNIHKWIIANEPEPNRQDQQKQGLNVDSFESTINDYSDNHHQEKCVNLNAISSMETLTEQVHLQDSTNEHNLPVYRSEDAQLKNNPDEETGHIEHPTQIQKFFLNTAIPENFFAKNIITHSSFSLYRSNLEKQNFGIYTSRASITGTK